MRRTIFFAVSGITIVVITSLLGWYVFAGETPAAATETSTAMPSAAAPAADSREYGFEVSRPIALEEVIVWLERDKNVTVEYSQCPTHFGKTMVAAGTHVGKTPEDFLERLRYRLRDSDIEYTISVSPRRLDIVCK
jgi:hypothetical protein